MQPTRLQRLIADHWLQRAYFTLCSAGAIVYTANILLPITTLSFAGIAWWVLLIPVAGALGFMLAIFPGVLVLGPFMHWASHRNGAPFQIGDQVMLLKRRYCGKVVTVYDVWESRGELRVTLGDAEREAVTDVFGYTQVCRTFLE